MDQLTLTPEEIRLRELTEVELSPARRLQLAEFVLSEIHQSPRRSRARVIGFIGALIAALTLTGGVAYAWIATTATPDDAYTAFCYPDQNPNRGDDWVGSEINAAYDAKDGSRAAVSVVSDCSKLWDLGVVHAAGAVVKPSGGNPVPELVACVNADGEAVVFPGPPTLCTKLGLASLA